MPRTRSLPFLLTGPGSGVALTAEENDLTLADVARLSDLFYIGGTKTAPCSGSTGHRQSRHKKELTEYPQTERRNAGEGISDWASVRGFVCG